nr:tetratricopeptide repeat protein [Bacteroidota bacterium]
MKSKHPYRNLYYGLLLILIGIFGGHSTAYTQNQAEVDSLKSILNSSPDKIVKVRTLLQLVDLLKNNQPDLALIYVKDANTLAKEENLDPEILRSTVRMASIYWGASDYKSSMKHAMRAIELATELKIDDDMAEAQRIIGQIYTDIGEYALSSKYYFESLKLYEKIGDKTGISRALNSIGYLYFEQKMFEKALEYYEKSLAISRQIDDKPGISRGLNNVAAVHAMLNQFDKVEQYIREAIEINKNIGRRLWEGVNYLNLADIYQDKKQYDTSLVFHLKAVDIFSELNNMPKLASIYLNLSEYYFEIGNTSESLTYARDAFEIGENNGLKQVMRDAAKELHDIYKTMDDLDNAYKYIHILHQMSDSLALEESLTKMAKLELQYKYEKQNQEQKLKQQRKDFYIIILIISLVSIIVVVLSLMTRQKMKQKNVLLQKQSLEDEVAFKNKELTINVLNLIKKNEILSDISNQLIHIKNNAVREETKAAILRVARDIKRTTDEEIWEEFELRFKQVHGEFYRKLGDQFPELSPNELKLCAFLRLNMSTKDISQMTGQRINT